MSSLRYHVVSVVNGRLSCLVLTYLALLNQNALAACPEYSPPPCWSNPSQRAWSTDNNGCRVPACNLGAKPTQCPDVYPPFCATGEVRTASRDNNGCLMYVCQKAVTQSHTVIACPGPNPQSSMQEFECRGRLYIFNSVQCLIRNSQGAIVQTAERVFCPKGIYRPELNDSIEDKLQRCGDFESQENSRCQDLFLGRRGHSGGTQSDVRRSVP